MMDEHWNEAKSERGSDVMVIWDDMGNDVTVSCGTVSKKNPKSFDCFFRGMCERNKNV